MKRQRGMTIAELMIALALGLLVTLLAGSLLVAANRGYVAQTERASVDDAGRYAMASIERAVRQAAFINREHDAAGSATDPAAPASISGLDDHQLGKASFGTDQPRAGAINGSDVLALRFAGSGSGDGDGSMAGCAGFPVGAQEEGWSIFYVATGGDGVAELRCKYRGQKNWSADAVVGGVDGFQVLYGLDTDLPPDGQANRYVSASEINALDAALVLAGATEPARERDRHRKTHWKRIASIKVALVLHGARRSRGADKPAMFHLFGPAYGVAADSGTRLDEAAMPDALRERERRLFSSTILLRNASLWEAP